MTLEKIKKLIIEVYNIQRKESHMQHNNKYKCKHYDTYEQEYEKTYKQMINKREELVQECNKFINYPQNKILCFDFTSKVEFKEESFIGLLFKVPFIDKKEYFCLISLFEEMEKYMFKWNSGEWVFK